jgi:hypothetical protein
MRFCARFSTQVHRESVESSSWNKREPATVRYTLRCLLVEGAELPVFRNITGAKAKLRVIVSIGSHKIRFASLTNKDGVLRWGPPGGGVQQEIEDIELPADLKQLPDVIIHLCRVKELDSAGDDVDGTSVCFARVPAAKLFMEKMKGPVYWQNLKEDRCRRGSRHALPKESFPGSLLLKLGFDRVEKAKSFAGKWDSGLLVERPMVGWHVRVYVYQARQLPASDADGALDPYLKLRFCGQSKQTNAKKKTTSPQWYESIR